MATHKTQQLDINLSRIQDEAVREAFTALLRFVNESSQRLRTNKDVRANDVVNQGKTAGFDKQGWLWANRIRSNDVANKEESAGFDQQGNLWCEDLEINDDLTVNGTLTAGHVEATSIDCNDVANQTGNVGWDSSGNFYAETLTIDGGGTFKVQVITGTISAGAIISIFSGATVLGVCGFAGSGAAWYPIHDLNDVGSIVQFDTATVGTEVLLKNSAGSSRSYRAVIFHT